MLSVIILSVMALVLLPNQNKNISRKLLFFLQSNKCYFCQHLLYILFITFMALYFGATPPSVTTYSLTTLCIMKYSITTYSITTLSIITFSIITLNVMKFSITAYNIMKLSITIQNTKLSLMLPWIVIILCDYV